ncbi:MAG: hypothetical protein CGW95_13510 [Phenylobacterium zucineum]|nr:MAG: hypothetical protein CGW95_13510 [Phenylobacterium zucineum]
MGKKKTKTSTTQTSHSVVTPTNADWVTQGAKSLSDRLANLGQGDPGRFVAPLSALETQAAGTAAGLGARPIPNLDPYGSGAGDSWLTGALNTKAPSAVSASLLDNLEAYQLPYRKQVTDAAMADFDAEAGRTRAAQDLSMAGEGAFSGSGAALTRSQTEGELARARSAQLSKLLADMYTTSASLAGQDADRRQQVSLANAQMAQQDMAQKAQMVLQDQAQKAQMAQFLAQHGLDQDANTRANIAAQAALGAQLRGVDQTQKQAPMTTLGQQIEMFSGLPASLFAGQVSDSQGSGTSSTTEADGTLGNYLSLMSRMFNMPNELKNALPG